ncbi:heme ABC exporter ATP-binding protein CcmA [candidate division KSB3 bacterium]|uniref:Heme ABC exporter ATP-binding protein CcmA n=1 Tax=candidate division KSB3 bacterium TaxID=2044937 RepID=A0A9D5JZ10_9BACT|nr:heme ABC exporter ATP-binding protein CcmA [candidate division KSB3 bacterium]MBD3326366.1 heme ABC exporter ATP-binding protein CcmA [candidate division KSB3 bacterium]
MDSNPVGEPIVATPIIEIHHLSKHYGKTEALREVTLSVATGTFLLMFGPNGSGKTTLIRILATLSQPTSGSVRLDGLDPQTHGDEVRQRIGVISHNSFLYPSLTAEENLQFYGKMFGLEHLQARLEQLLQQVGLLSRRHDPVRTFSRGMQQRLSIARALLHNPAIVLFDEPYSGLDVAAITMLRQLLDTFHAEGRTILLTTHDYQRDTEHCDQLVILVKGNLTYTGTPDSISADEIHHLLMDQV